MKQWQSNLKALFAAAILMVGVFTPFASANVETSQVCFPVDLRGDSTEVCLTVFENPKAWCSGATALAVHGLAETAETWRPLAKKIFNAPLYGSTVKRIIALDLPGHGKSLPPVGLQNVLFGELLIDDNISVILQSIMKLQEMDLAPRVIMGHSMGGLAIQGLQEALLNSDLSLAHLGIFRAILFAPVPASGADWNMSDSGDISDFIFTTTELGTFVKFPPEVDLIGGSYTVLDGSIVPNAPSLEELEVYGSMEPIFTVLQLTSGNPELPPRPYARQGAFSIVNGTILNLIAFSQDVLVPEANLNALYTYLTGCNLDLFYRNIKTADACHSMTISNPAEVVKALRTLPPF